MAPQGRDDNHAGVGWGGCFSLAHAPHAGRMVAGRREPLPLPHHPPPPPLPKCPPPGWPSRSVCPTARGARDALRRLLPRPPALAQGVGGGGGGWGCMVYKVNAAVAMGRWRSGPPRHPPVTAWRCRPFPPRPLPSARSPGRLPTVTPARHHLAPLRPTPATAGSDQPPKESHNRRRRDAAALPTPGPTPFFPTVTSICHSVPPLPAQTGHTGTTR